MYCTLIHIFHKYAPSSFSYCINFHVYLLHTKICYYKANPMTDTVKEEELH